MASNGFYLYWHWEQGTLWFPPYPSGKRFVDQNRRARGSHSRDLWVDRWSPNNLNLVLKAGLIQNCTMNKNQKVAIFVGFTP